LPGRDSKVGVSVAFLVLIFGGLPSNHLDWLLPATFGVCAVAAVAWAGLPLRRMTGRQAAS
jgi:hypothetical protein